MFGLVGGESLAAGANCSSCPCQEPQAPPGWGCHLLLPPCLICLGRDCMREAPAYSPQSSPALAKGRGGTGERGRFSEVSTAGARCPSTAVVGLVVMGELAWAVGEGKDGEWLKGGPSHVCTDARELSGQFPHSGCCPGRFSWPPGKRRGSCSRVSATNCSLPDRKRRRATPIAASTLP